MSKILLNIKKHKKVFIISVSVLIVLIACAVFLFTKNSTDSTVYSYQSSLYNGLTYVGKMKDNLPNGEGIINDKDGKIKINGTFENGYLKKGTIYMEEAENNTKTFTGDFNKFDLKSGKIIIVDPKNIVTKTGTFTNNKLNGTGSMIIKDIKTENVKFSYTGKFKDDKPVNN